MYVIKLTWRDSYWCADGGWTDWRYQATQYRTEAEADAVCSGLRTFDKDCVVIAR